MKSGKYILGLMSGSSLDGLDLALIHFSFDFYREKKWELIKGQTIPYSANWINQLKNATPKDDYQQLHLDFGTYIGELIQEYLDSLEKKPELIAVHGHTLYHEPSEGVSVQLGAAQSIANITGVPTMDDFRTQDILLGGEGAPLAPTAEHWLYSEHNVFLNIGGILNLSHHNVDKIIAFDIGPGNQLLNTLAQEVGLAFDNDGQLGKKGSIISSLLDSAKANSYYQKHFPKSLSNQWVQEEVIPLFQDQQHALEDRMATAVALISWSLQTAIDQVNLRDQNILVSGGGAYNGTLIKTMQQALEASNNRIIIPEDDVINYKEAALMGLMGYLNITGSNNIFGQSTGSKINHCAGNLCVPKSFPLV